MAETVRIGGNGFHITKHLRPSALGSSCHRISETMLYLPDDFQDETFTPQTASADNPADSSSEKPKNRSTFYANAGYGFIVGKILLPEGSSGNPAQGFDFNIGYDYAINPI